jgi:hypothetical protein
MELMVGVAISSILVLGLAAYIRDVAANYNLQSQVDDMVANAHYSLQRLSETLMQAGAALPVKADTVVKWDTVANGGFKIHSNPKGGMASVAWACTTSRVPIDTFGLYFGISDSLIITHNDTLVSCRRVVAGVIDDVDSLHRDSLILSAPVTFTAGDMIYDYRTERYGITPGGSLYFDSASTGDTSAVMAENIDSLKVSFDYIDTNGVTHIVNNWTQALNAQVSIVSRTERPEPVRNLYHKQRLSLRFRLKNKVITYNDTLIHM